MLVRIIIVLVVAAAVFGSAGFFYYELFIRPDIELQEELARQPAEPTPTPDVSLPAYEALQQLDRANDLIATRNAYLNFVERYPSSSKIQEAKEALGEMNADIVLTTFPDESKTNYTVVSGDSMIRIANKTGTNAELIYRANNMSSINLDIGRELLIPTMDPAIVIDGEALTLTLYNGGEFFKEYPILSYGLPGGKLPAPGQTTVKDKLALSDGKRVAFASSGFADSDRWLMLGIPGLIIRGTPPPQDPAAESPPPMPPGIILAPGDAEELFVLVSQGTPVTIK